MIWLCLIGWHHWHAEGSVTIKRPRWFCTEWRNVHYDKVECCRCKIVGQRKRPARHYY